MKDKFFIDTNIVIYLFDNKNPEKQKTANTIIKDAIRTGNGTVSFQVVQEFCNTAVKKFENPLSTADCKKFINKFLGSICTVFPSMELYNLTLDIKDKTGYGYYDSLILAAALQDKCSILYSEDMQNGQIIEGMKIANPFISKK